jgi:hypothetical protein
MKRKGRNPLQEENGVKPKVKEFFFSSTIKYSWYSFLLEAESTPRP